MDAVEAADDRQKELSAHAPAAELRRDRATICFFAVGGTQAPHTRERGAAFVLQARSALAQLIEAFLARPETRDEQRRLDMMCRLLIAMAFQQVMFDQNEVSPLRLSDKELADEWAAALHAVLAKFVAPIASP